MEQSWLDELREFISIPSVSADPAHQDDLRRAAEWVRDFVKRAGGEAELVPKGTRDLVIGVTVVLGDGTVASSGGKVVKNVAGYDLGKLFCGSKGTLGLVARLCVRLHPRPAANP